MQYSAWLLQYVLSYKPAIVDACMACHGKLHSRNTHISWAEKTQFTLVRQCPVTLQGKCMLLCITVGSAIHSACRSGHLAIHRWLEVVWRSQWLRQTRLEVDPHIMSEYPLPMICAVVSPKSFSSRAEQICCSCSHLVKATFATTFVVGLYSSVEVAIHSNFR